jgi:CheY-like chemotaxis protein
MGGSVRVESQVDRGTRFIFDIDVSLSSPHTRKSENHLATGLKGKKVLVVNDNTTSLLVLSNQLKQWDLTPALAKSGKEALEILSQVSDIDFLIVDMEMPEMDGGQLAQQVRQTGTAIPILMLTGMNADRAKVYAECCSVILSKPVRLATLHDHILILLKQKDKNALSVVENKILEASFAQEYPLDILITEDNPVNQKLAERVLTKLGYKPEKALNGLEALEAVKRKNYDVILMDIQMPIMDGIECTQKIRQKQGTQPVIIAMTANAMAGDREKCIQAGMDDYISKPVKLEDLVNLLKKWCPSKNEQFNSEMQQNRMA